MPRSGQKNGFSARAYYGKSHAVDDVSRPLDEVLAGDAVPF